MPDLESWLGFIGTILVALTPHTSILGFTAQYAIGFLAKMVAQSVIGMAVRYVVGLVVKITVSKLPSGFLVTIVVLGSLVVQLIVWIK